MSQATAVYLSESDWRIIVRELRDAKRVMLEVERDHPSHTNLVNAARVESERISATINNVLAQVVIDE